MVVWTEQKDVLMLKEVAAEGTLQHKLKSRERGAGWLAVANKLKPSMLAVDITSRSVRDRFGMLARKHKVKMANEENETGGGGEELTEKEILLEELIDICEETEKKVDEENEAKKKSNEREKAQAIEMRERAMESFGTTKKRALEGQENAKPERKRRRSGDTFEWLREKTEMDKKLREEELKEKKEERESQKEERMVLLQQIQASQAQNNAQLQYQMQQQQQHQHQCAMLHQQMMAVMQQQQQQTEMMANFFKNINK